MKEKARYATLSCFRTGDKKGYVFYPGVDIGTSGTKAVCMDGAGGSQRIHGLSAMVLSIWPGD